MEQFFLLIIAIVFSYIYAFVSGFTDAANAIATSIGTRALSPRVAVLMAGILELVGALTGTAVALTLARGIVSPPHISLSVIIAGIGAAMFWSLFTYYFGLPISETHGLIGGIIGAVISVAGAKAIHWISIFKILIAIVVSPLLGFFVGMFLMTIIYTLFHSLPAYKAGLIFKSLQRFSSAFMAFSHGRNDAQKPMGVLVLTLAIYYGWQNPTVPLWVILSIGITAGLGVAFGGWRIIKTLGMKITSLSVEQGFASETSAALVLQLASLLGIPVSTTQTITSSIIGAGVARRISGVHWSVTLDILISWILTLPATIFLGWLFTLFLRLIL